MHNLKVLKLHLYKEKPSPEHEYIVAKIFHLQQSHTFLRIKCCVNLVAAGKDSSEQGDPVQIDDNTTSSTQPSQSTSLLTPSVSMSSSAQLSGKADTLDVVNTMSCGEWPPENCNTLIKKVVCNSNCPAILLHLVILTNVVHEDSPKYHTLPRQCYWYANMIMCAFQSLFPEITQERHEGSGRWNKIKIHDSKDTEESRATVHKVKLAFKKCQDHINDLVHVVGRLHRHYTHAHNGQHRSIRAESDLIIS